MNEVEKYAAMIPISRQVLTEHAAFWGSVQDWMNATPEQRDEWRRQAAEERAAVREATPSVPLTIEALVDKLDWTREYAEHFVQSYCECYDGMDQWEYCQHARDLGLVP